MLVECWLAGRERHVVVWGRSGGDKRPTFDRWRAGTFDRWRQPRRRFRRGSESWSFTNNRWVRRRRSRSRRGLQPMRRCRSHNPWRTNGGRLDRTPPAEDRLASWSHAGMGNHLCFCQLLRWQSYQRMRHRLAATEDIGGYSGGCHLLVRIVNVVDVGHVDDVGYVCHISNVRDVHLKQVFPPAVIPREEGLTRSQWKPGLHTNTDAYGEAGSAHERDKCRAIDGGHGNRTRHPSPDGSNQCPASIVKRGETPSFVLHPGPSPRLNPHPVAETIGHPIYRNSRGKPNRTVIRSYLPSAMIVQVRNTGNVAVHILRGCK